MFSSIGKTTTVDGDKLSMCYLVEDLMLALGFRNSLVGRIYLRDCLVEVLLADKHAINLSEDVYPVIANRYSTTIASVSKAIRHCLITCYNDGNLKRANKIFRYDIIGSVPPTNAEFVTTMAIFIKRHMRFRDNNCSQITYFHL